MKEFVLRIRKKDKMQDIISAIEFLESFGFIVFQKMS